MSNATTNVPATTPDKKQPRRKRAEYVVNCEYISDRDGDYATRDRVCEPWEAADGADSSDTCGSIRPMFAGDTCELVNGWPTGDNRTPLYQQISSALLMYRCACTFPGKIDAYGPDGYKCAWSMTVRHKASGLILIFGEHKAGASIWMQTDRAKWNPESFLLDVQALVQYLCSRTCAHPYDGTIAGSVA